MPPRARITALLILVALAVVTATAPARADDFVNFETEHVRPLALSPDGNRLFAVNTPDDRLTIYDLGPTGLVLAAEVPVGLAPVAVATRTNGAGTVEAWVVNHLSDSVSVVTIDALDPSRSRVTATLAVGDEPRDIVFAGSAHDRAFVTCARRGQSRFPGDEADGPQLASEGVGRADVWVFAAEAPATPLTIVQLFGDTPRALAASPDGSTVYAAIFRSGNRTTCVNESARASLGPLPPPPAGGRTDGPSTGLIVRYDPGSGTWRDELATDWSAGVNFTLPDQDVFLIDADATPPTRAGGTDVVTGVGTILFAMAVNPASGKLHVANTEARNDVRFVGLFDAARGVTGHVVEHRVSVVDGTVATPVHLNPHIDYGVAPGPPAEIVQSLAAPVGLAFTGDGATLFVAAHDSAKIGAFAAADLETGVVSETRLAVGLGPSGLVFDGARDRLYVMNAIDHSISVVGDAASASRAVIATLPLPFDPSPPAVRNGRAFLYDASRSAHGDASCASCHVFGDNDGLSWDLGDPFGDVVPNLNPFLVPPPVPEPVFHPMKGPMATQSLRGMAEAGPMHWRGDRTGANVVGGDPLDEVEAFTQFNAAFIDLLGADSELDPADMQAFADFALTLRYPPNPIRRLDDALTPLQASGADLYFTGGPNAHQPCAFCHVTAIAADGRSTDDGEPQQFKVPHLRNVYQKVGMFGVPPNTLGIPETGPYGDQIRGFGILHDGSAATVFDALLMIPGLLASESAALQAFLMAFDTGLKPIVGQQATLTAATLADGALAARLDLLVARATAGDCDLVVRGRVGTAMRGWAYDPATARFTSDRVGEPLRTDAALRADAATVAQERTYTCVPPGTGRRAALDRDRDGVFDRNELDHGTDPAQRGDVTLAGSVTTVGASVFQLKGTQPGHAAQQVKIRVATKKDTAAHRIASPAAGGPNDPTLVGATLRLFNSAGSGEQVTVALPPSGWTTAGTGPKRRYTFRALDGPIKKVQLAADRVSVDAGRTGLSVTLDEAAQGSMAMVLSFGTDLHWCAEAGRSPYPATTDVVGRFKGRAKTPAPLACPLVPPA